jgi:hypothetical protein
MLAENVKKLDSDEMKKLSESFEEDKEEVPNKKLTPKEMDEFLQRNKSKKS